jgi:hypothetical protein
MDDLPSGAAAEFPVMAGLVPAIHVLLPYATKDGDARHISREDALRASGRA